MPKKWYGGILAGGMFPNISDLPIAYLQTMDQGFIFTEEEGEKGVASVIIFLAMFLICLFNMGGFRFIESDFHYNDEENALTEAESSVLQTLNENKNKNTTPSATQENPRETSRESYKESSEGNTSVSNNYSKSQEDNTEEEQIMTVEQDLSLHDNQDNNDSGSRASTCLLYTSRCV